MSQLPQLKLPAVLDVTCAGALTSQLKDLRGAPLVLDASAVERVGGLGLQVLLSARVTWAADGEPLAVAAPSAAFQDALALSGARPFDLSESLES
ncbi:STAS domain-containing protein [Phenylobacterium sp.]|jgi:anti-anti-sigma regulatory factor|uniref:STAS domain-containing protein n=1 Tax=Phenylobacterium sp. TaxID=1871053 RepID=UPI002F3EE2A3